MIVKYTVKKDSPSFFVKAISLSVLQTGKAALIMKNTANIKNVIEILGLHQTFMDCMSSCQF